MRRISRSGQQQRSCQHAYVQAGYGEQMGDADRPKLLHRLSLRLGQRAAQQDAARQARVLRVGEERVDTRGDRCAQIEQRSIGVALCRFHLQRSGVALRKAGNALVPIVIEPVCIRRAQGATEPRAPARRRAMVRRTESAVRGPGWTCRRAPPDPAARPVPALPAPAAPQFARSAARSPRRGRRGTAAWR